MGCAVRRWTIQGGWLAVAVALGACASPGPQAPARAAVMFAPHSVLAGHDGRRPLLSGYVADLGKAELSLSGGAPRADARDILGSRMRVEAEDGVLQAESRLQIESGDIADPERWAAGWRARSLGRQVSVQQLGTRIPDVIGAPLNLRLSQRQETQWLVESGSVERAQEQAELSWSPAAATFNLSWSERSGVAPAPLECSVQGGVRLARSVFAGAPALQLRGRSCEVFSARLPAVQSAQGWSAALSWSQGRDDTALRLLALQPQMAALETAAYELGLTRTQYFGDWRASGGVALRRSSRVSGRRARDYWSADAQLRRSLRTLDLTASYRAGAADDWFLPLPAAQSERLALGVDLAPWFRLNLPAAKLGMSLSYQWQRQESPLGRQIEDGLLHGRLRWTW